MRVTMWLLAATLVGCIEEQRAREAAEYAVDQAGLVNQLQAVISLCDSLVDPADAAA